MPDYHVRVSDQALEDMVLAASEAYILGPGRKKEERQEGRIETYGHLWGNRREDDNNHTHILIDRFSVSLSAWGTREDIRPHPDDIHLKNEIIMRWSPHLCLLGDFHTHPYANHDEVNKCKGWNFSQIDKRSFKEEDSLWKLSRPYTPIMAVMAIAKMGRVHRSTGEWKEDNRWMFNVGEYRFWLSIGIGKISKSKKRKSFSTSGVYLDLDPRFVNETGDRLRHWE